jgi:hypothetical protein
MNKVGWLIVMFFSCGVCSGQNLVPNPSFEDTVSCPVFGGQVNLAVGWHAVATTPDYFNACTTTSAFDVPLNTCGYQYPATGQAYVGLDTYDVIDTTYREIIGAFLTSSMIIGIKYFVSFKASFSAGIFQAINIAANKLGILFSTVDYLSNPPPINNFCQVYTDSIISDSLNWTTIKGSFIADSAYSFISIGNFFQNFFTDTIHLNPTNHTRAYYYIDDVCVSTDSLTCNSTVGINELKNQDDLILFPNPFTDKVNITIKRNELLEVSLYDVTSRKIFNQSFTIPIAIGTISINTEQLAKGIYLYEVRNKNGVIKKGKVVKE